MRKFFEGIFGGSSRKNEVPQEAARPAEPRREDAELVNLRERKFRAALDEFAGRKVDDNDFALAKKELSGDGQFPQLSAEEMRVKAREISGRLFSNGPELVPVEAYDPAADTYEKMGKRRAAFESAFAKELGRSVTQRDMEAARKMFELDADIQQRWSTMVGEEVASYARNVADRIHSYDRAAAAK